MEVNGAKYTIYSFPDGGASGLLQVALRVERRDAGGFNFSFLRIPRMVASTVARIILLSLVICVTAVLGSPHLEKRGGLLQ
jgi:hypothetical protein